MLHLNRNFSFQSSGIFFNRKRTTLHQLCFIFTTTNSFGCQMRALRFLDIMQRLRATLFWMVFFSKTCFYYSGLCFFTNTSNFTLYLTNCLSECRLEDLDRSNAVFPSLETTELLSLSSLFDCVSASKCDQRGATVAFSLLTTSDQLYFRCNNCDRKLPSLSLPDFPE